MARAPPLPCYLARPAVPLRLAAQSLWHAQNYLGDLYRRWKARLRGPKAITAMAHKLARVLWHLLKYKEPFNSEVFAKEEEKMQRKKLARLHNMAASLTLPAHSQPMTSMPCFSGALQWPTGQPSRRRNFRACRGPGALVD